MAEVAAPPLAVIGTHDEAVTLRLDQIRPGPFLRSGGLNEAHVTALAEVSAGWPPVVVTEDNMLVDGHHRLAAARVLEWDAIRAVVFKGSRADAYVEAVRSNVSHGLPLTLSERQKAGRQILTLHPAWSDRRIAGSCGLSDKTVKRLREESEQQEHPASPRARAGRDGRIRPVDAHGLRASIRAELARNPDASLRAIAGAVGASPETVRSVRNQLRAEAESHATPLEAHDDGSSRTLPMVERDERASQARDDPAFTCDANGTRFAAWFDKSAVPHRYLSEHVDAVPLSRVYVVADEARRRAKFWEDFADALEARTRR